MTKTKSHFFVVAVVVLMFGAGSAQSQDLLNDLLGAIEELVTGEEGTTAGLTDADITSGLLEALRVGTERVVASVSAVDGYNLDDAIHIPLPENLHKVQEILATVGLSSLGDDLELKLNRAAEAAAPLARDVFWNSIDQMTMDDALGIFNGPNDAATRYFERTMTPQLVTLMRPIIDNTLADVGALQAYDQMMAPYQALPLVPDVKGDLQTYAVEQALGGMFFKLAEEEAAIREDPAKRTTEILERVFGRG